MNKLRESQDELETFSRRLCIRISGVEMAKNETSNDVLQNITSIIEEFSSETTEVAIDNTHEFSKVYTDKMFYHNRESLNRNGKVKLDLTKKIYLISNKAIKLLLF